MADLATNKVLTLAGRTQIRDYLDVMELHAEYLTLGAMVWAACGKDPGYSPQFLLDMANRHTRYQQSDLETANLTRPVDLQTLKMNWVDARERAEKLCVELPREELGCLYLDQDRKPVTPDPSSEHFPSLIRHFGSPRGSWPVISCE